MRSIIYSFQSEWLKRKGSLASWLVICGAFFTPAIILSAKIVRHSGLTAASILPDYWQSLWKSGWESMAIFLLPLGAILASSLITQIEYKNNSWKLIHTTPQSYSVIFLAKLAVIVVMMLQFLVLFNIGIYIAAYCLACCLVCRIQNNPYLMPTLSWKMPGTSSLAYPS